MNAIPTAIPGPGATVAPSDAAPNNAPARAAAADDAAAPAFARLMQRAAQRVLAQDAVAAAAPMAAVVAGVRSAATVPADTTAAGIAAGTGSEVERAAGAAGAEAMAPAATDVASLMAALLHRPPPPSRPGDDTADGKTRQPPVDDVAAAAPVRDKAAAEAIVAEGPQQLAHAAADPQTAADPQAFVLPTPPAVAPAAPPPAAPSPAPYAAQIAAPVGSPDFAPGLSAQVSLMLRDGLQEAILQLHPAEMGPITVQIAIDGGSAQVTMAAELHATRQALEQAMPELAGTLRDSGLTLTGGGVFDQPRRDADAPAQQHGDGASGRTGPGHEAAAPAAGGQPASQQRRGLVDLIA